MSQKLEKISAEAHEMVPGDWDTYLAVACADDAELRLEIQRLLIEPEKADSIFHPIPQVGRQQKRGVAADDDELGGHADW